MNALSNGSRLNLLPLNVLSRDFGRWIDELAGDENAHAAVPASIWEDDSHFYFEFDLPGILVDDIEVKVVENALYMSAQRHVDSDINYTRQERKFGSFERQFVLPSRIDESAIEAEMKNGVLKVTVPKAPEAQVKKIEIQSS